MERVLEDRGREAAEVWDAARGAEDETWAAISLEQVLWATVYAQTAAQQSRIKQVNHVMRLNAPRAVLRWHGSNFLNEKI